MIYQHWSINHLPLIDDLTNLIKFILIDRYIEGIYPPTYEEYRNMQSTLYGGGKIYNNTIYRQSTCKTINSIMRHDNRKMLITYKNNIPDMVYYKCGKNILYVSLWTYNLYLSSLLKTCPVYFDEYIPLYKLRCCLRTV